MTRKLAHTIGKVVPWGRTYDEYRSMFALDPADLERRILGCADGPAAFNAAFHAKGGGVVSVDPLYTFSSDAIRRRIDEAKDLIVANTIENRDAYVWDRIPSIEALLDLRMGAMGTFLEDYDAGRREGRYLPGALPALPFHAGSFDLALCSHFLFTYSDTLSQAFHVAAILEMLRVAGEVRIFPLLHMDAPPSPHLDPICAELSRHGFAPEVVRVPYEFQKGGDRMLRIVSA